jgi:Carboxypeptidase regulatory-like domain
MVWRETSNGLRNNFGFRIDRHDPSVSDCALSFSRKKALMRVLRALIVLAISLTSVDVIAARPGQAPSSASLSGTASDNAGQVRANTGVQLRNVSTGQLVGSTTTNAAGQFSFVGLTPGTYVVEVVNTAGQIVGTSGSVVVSAGAAVTGVGVTTAPATAAATTVAAHGLSRHVTLILGAAAAAGVAGGIAVATGGTASPSQ